MKRNRYDGTVEQLSYTLDDTSGRCHWAHGAARQETSRRFIIACASFPSNEAAMKPLSWHCATSAFAGNTAEIDRRTELHG